MIEIIYEDNSTAQYHENGDNVEITKTKYLVGGQHVEYKKGTKGKIEQFHPITSHPLLSFLNINVGQDTILKNVSHPHIVSLDKPRVSLTKEESNSFIIYYDEDNKIILEKRKEEV